MSKVSIIVPIYKVEKYLDDCVKSIVNQTYKDIEIILVNDGSPDNCPGICDKWAKKDNRIKVIHKQNGGASEARNAGLDMASGDYIGFVDGDDVISPEMYNKLVYLIESNNADISICQESRFYEGKTPIYTNEEKTKIINNDDALKNLLKEKIITNVWNKLYKKEVFNDVKFPVGTTYEDVYVSYKVLLNSKKIVITNSKLYGYMQRTDSVTGSCTVKSIEDYIEVINSLYDELKSNKELIYYLNIFKIKAVYAYHVKAIVSGEKYFYYSDKILNEYKYLKEIMNFKYFIAFIEDDVFKTKIYKIILLLNRNLFFRLMNRKK